MAARQRYQVMPGTGEGQRLCARAERCSAKTRDQESGEWLPAPANQPLCPADRDILITHLGEIPACYERLARLALEPVKAGSAVRVPPGSRVLASPEADALMRVTADTLGGWAARVRAVPQLSLARHGHPHGSQGQVAADCATLAAHPDPLLALAAGDMLRTWTFPPGRTGAARLRPVPCRHCGLPVSPAPSGKRWWPAVCTHAAADPVMTVPDDDKPPVLIAWLCRACARRLPARWQAPASCHHEPSAAVPARSGGIPADIEEQIAGLEVVRAGDGWVTVITRLDGEDAALELIDLRHRAVRLLRETPAPPDLLDGVPCRACEAMSSLELVPTPPPDPEKPEPPYSRCTVPGCHDEMTRKEYDAWVRQYEAWTRGAGVLTCRRCDLGDCDNCCWARCSCASGGHLAAA